MFSTNNVFKIVALGLSLISFNVAAKSEFTIGVEDTEYLPIHTTKDGVFSGYAIDLLNDFAKKNNYTFKFTAVPVKRLIIDYLKPDSKIDFKYPDNESWDGDVKGKTPMIYSEAVFENREGLMVLPSAVNNKDINNIKSVGTGRGFSMEEPYDGLSKAGKIKLSEASDIVGLVRMGLLKHVDAIYLDEAIGTYILQNAIKEPDGLVFNANLPFVMNKFKISAVKSEEREQLILKLNKYLASETETLNKLKDKYGIRH